MSTPTPSYSDKSIMQQARLFVDKYWCQNHMYLKGSKPHMNPKEFWFDVLGGSEDLGCCLSGALAAACYGCSFTTQEYKERLNKMLSWINYLVWAMSYQRVADWNDDRDRTKEEVLQFIDSACDQLGE